MKARWLVCLMVAWFVFVGGNDKPPPMLRFHVQISPKFGKENIIPVTLVDPAATIFVGKHPDLDEKHIHSLEMMKDGGVVVVFNSEGTRKLEEITRANLDAIMVVICNSRVVYAPIIDMVMKEGRFLIPQGINSQDILELRSVIQAEPQKIK